MKITFLSQANAERLVPNNDSAMISIVGKRSPPRNLKGWKHELDLHFDDITQPADGLKAFSRVDALQVKNFVSKLPSNIKTIYVHCHQGVSRSAAIAKWINEVYRTGDFPIFYSIYNPLVYRMLKTT